MGKLVDVTKGSELDEEAYIDFRRNTMWATSGLAFCGCPKLWPMILHEWYSEGEHEVLKDHFEVYECTGCAATYTPPGIFSQSMNRAVIWCDKDVCDHG